MSPSAPAGKVRFQGHPRVVISLVAIDKLAQLPLQWQHSPLFSLELPY
jgi:hypothetical protein